MIQVQRLARGRPKGEQAPQSVNARQRKCREGKFEERLQNVAVLDMETDPFDKDKPNERIEPFLAVLYRDDVDPVIIWDEDRSSFTLRVISAIEALPGKFTVYAHNGGRFDYLFLIHHLRGDVSFKGRGIMSAKVGEHELRDSFHIIPERLANYDKEKFDYKNMAKGRRANYRQQIIDYCISDCRKLLDIVKAFLKEFGFKLSIGQAAMTRIKKHYKVATLTGGMDAELRRYFFGGRVECLAGRGKFDGPFKLYDVNSMYPKAMADFLHPIGSDYYSRVGAPSIDTVFLDIECDNYGALVKRTAFGETTADEESGGFLTTIHEYRTALKLGLIKNVKINFCVDCVEQSNFEKFVVPLYENRLKTKDTMKKMVEDGLENTQEYMDVKKDDIFYKLLLNNGYGKFAQNPRNFKEHHLTSPGERPPDIKPKKGEEFIPWEDLPHYECDEYWIWQRPCPRMRFNNVGTAASITGAARAILMEAIYNAREPIYCDTDSLICLELKDTEIHPTKLGAWDLEAEFSSVIINGKKQYACSPANGGKPKIRQKGMPGLSWGDMESMLRGDVLSMVNPAPTLTRSGAQYYVRRNLRATAQPGTAYHGRERRTICHPQRDGTGGK